MDRGEYIFHDPNFDRESLSEADPINQINKTVRLWRCGNWEAWLQTVCDRLRYHPIFKNLEQDSIEKAACETCKKYVLTKNQASAIA
ncbi:MAG: hypothetical protein RMX65_010025 [Nostoc sp. DedQUE01]|nr:hypothetical protein [Nostoc sp. DedQUE11]MDZ8072629.1 hypothetical protein [Nostoc sp. DedQUE01]